MLAVLPVPGLPHMNMFLARPIVKMLETLEAMNVISVSRQSGMPSGGSDCASSTERSCSILLFFVSNSGMVCHIDRRRQTPEGGLLASLYPYSNIKFMMP